MAKSLACWPRCTNAATWFVEKREFLVEGNDRNTAVRIFFDAVLTAEPILNELGHQHGLSLAQIRCLFHLRWGPKTAGDLAQSLGLRATSLTRIIERLEEGHWIQRQSDPHDRRRVVIALTGEAESRLSHLDFFGHSAAASAIGRLESGERGDFVRILSRYLACVEDEGDGRETD